MQDSDNGERHAEGRRRRLGSGAYERVAPLDLLRMLAECRTGADADRLASAFDKLEEDPEGEAELYRPLVDTLRERAHAFERQVELAGRDELTGIANRRTFNEVLEREVARCRRTGRPLSLLLLDLDGLKRINDERGHLAGDEAICAVARACTASLRGSDAVARIGGDEFAIILPETAAAQTAVITARIRRRLAMDPKTQAGTGVSIGSAVMTGPGMEADALVAAADAAMYDDKRARNARRA